jgi:lipopolysaccharide transport system ATP-binding protein
MSTTVLSVENVYKRYRLGVIGRDTLKDDLLYWWIKLRGKNLADYYNIDSNDRMSGSSEYVWALKDVSFDVNEGEVLGIIGKNGAGKSTLLKLLSKVTNPTQGKIKIKGRIASLLEVGTGFHPELSGRDNIFLNGAILGMRKHEINSKLDEIISFSGIGKYIDTPVKRYSSGMYVRLAFAVAAHLDPEILIIDEVLAVGDAEFQKKCLGKMKDVSGQGRTVLFVSHNMNSVETLCNRAILMEYGTVKFRSDNVRHVINSYLSFGDEAATETAWQNTGKISHECFTLQKFFLADAEGNILPNPMRNDQDVYLNIEGDLHRPDNRLRLGFQIVDDQGGLIYFSFDKDMDEQNWLLYEEGKLKIRAKLPQHLLNEGDYFIQIYADLYHIGWVVEPEKVQLKFSIRGGLSNSPYYVWARPGILAPILKWEKY